MYVGTGLWAVRRGLRKFVKRTVGDVGPYDGKLKNTSHSERSEESCGVYAEIRRSFATLRMTRMFEFCNVYSG